MTCISLMALLRRGLHLAGQQCPCNGGVETRRLIVRLLTVIEQERVQGVTQRFQLVAYNRVSFDVEKNNACLPPCGQRRSQVLETSEFARR